MATALTPPAAAFSGNPWFGAATNPGASAAGIPDYWMTEAITGQDPKLWLDKKMRSLMHPANPIRTRAQQFGAGVFQGANLGPGQTGLSAVPNAFGANKLVLASPLSTAARWGTRFGRAIPYMPAVGNLMEGDLPGAGLSAGGAMLGGAIGSVVPGIGTGAGAIVGGMLGEPIGKGVGRLAGGIIGGVTDWSDPLSGKDISLLGIPLTPYAKTKSKQKKALALAEMRLPLYNKIAQADTQRNMALNSMNNASQIIANVYGSNPFR